MDVVNESIYDHPKYYDLVFGSDCAAEIRFILGCAERYLKRPAKRFFEPACGTGRLLFALAKKGYDVDGLDLNAKAIEFCNARFQRHEMDYRATVGDMTDFKLRRKADIAFNTINSFRHLASEDSALSHLQCVGKAVKAGGIYLLGVHLTPTTGATCETESWTARRGHLSINTHMWPRKHNRSKRIERFGIRFDIHSPTRAFRIEDTLVLRSYSPKQMSDLISKAGCWQLIANYDFGYDLRCPIEVDEQSEDVVYVLRKT